MGFIRKFVSFWGVAPNATGHAEKIISGAGGFLGILLAMGVSLDYLGAQGAALLVASMGASAVLLFAVPHGALSQPWPLLGGHVISAVIGVACAQSVEYPLLAAPLAVALAITAMHYLRCIHPPGGATALTAVIGGTQLHDLGYQFVITPVLLNAVLMLCSAIAVNYAFAWRRYPASLMKQAERTPTASLTQEDFEFALSELGSYVDISKEDLSSIYRLAAKHAHLSSDQPEQITTGLCYSNGEQGAELSVRRVIELSTESVTFRILAGDGLGEVHKASLPDFSNWQRYEVILKHDEWHRIRPSDLNAAEGDRT